MPTGARSRDTRARSSAEEHYLDMVGVTGSIPVAPTTDASISSVFAPLASRHDLPMNFASQDVFRDPIAGVKRMRAAGPVVGVRLPIIGRIWMTTTQEMAFRVLKESQLFTSRKDNGAVVGLPWWMPRIRV